MKESKTFKKSLTQLNHPSKPTRKPKNNYNYAIEMLKKWL